MNKLNSLFVTAIFLVALVVPVYSQKCPPGSIRVRGHITKRGKVVKPHCRTRPDRNKRNNWSTKGNRNPVTKKRGWIKY